MYHVSLAGTVGCFAQTRVLGWLAGRWVTEIWLRSLVRRLAERKVAGWTYVPRFARGFDARTVEEWTRDSPWRFRVVEDRTPMVVEFGGVWELRLVTYQGFPAAVPGAGAPPW